MEAESSGNILVTNIPETATREKLYIHFQRQRNGGGDIDTLVYPKSATERNSAVVKFEDPDTRKSVLKHNHLLRPQMKQIDVSEQPFDIFETTEARLTKKSLRSLKQQPEAVQQIEDEFSLKLGRDGSFKGEFFQIVALDEHLKHLPSDYVKPSANSPSQGGQGIPRYPQSTNQTNFVGDNANLPEGNSSTETDEGNYKDAPTHRKFASLSHEVDDRSGNAQLRSLQSSKADVPENYSLHRKSKGSKIEFDKDVLSLIKKSRPRDIQRIFETYQVRERTKDDVTLLLTFHQSKDGDDSENGIAQFQAISDDIHERMHQENYEIPDGVGPNLIEGSIEKVARAFPTVVISSNREKVMFIALTEQMRECGDAKETFRTFVELNNDRLTYASAVSSAVAHRYRDHQRWDSLFEFTFPYTKLKVLVIKGDIASQDTDAIVNAANSRLHNGGGVTGAIFRAGGSLFEDECREFMRRKGKDLAVGEVVHTKAYGSLKCKNVIHVTGPMWSELRYRYARLQQAEAKCKEIMYKICSDLIDQSNSLRAKSVAIPAISTGIYGVRLEIFCNAMIQSITGYQYKAKGKGPTLREIRLVNFNTAEADEIAQHFKRWGLSKKSSSTAV